MRKRGSELLNEMKLAKKQWNLAVSFHNATTSVGNVIKKRGSDEKIMIEQNIKKKAIETQIHKIVKNKSA